MLIIRISFTNGQGAVPVRAGSSCTREARSDREKMKQPPGYRAT